MAKRSYPLPPVKNEMKIVPGPKLAEEVSKPGKEVPKIWDDSSKDVISENK